MVVAAVVVVVVMLQLEARKLQIRSHREFMGHWKLNPGTQIHCWGRVQL